MVDRESTSTPGQGPLTGFTGGMWKVVTAPLRVPATVLKRSVQKNIIVGSTFGLVEGMGSGVANVITGTVQMVTSAIPSNPLELVSRKMDYINAAK